MIANIGDQTAQKRPVNGLVTPLAGASLQAHLAKHATELIMNLLTFEHSHP